MDRLHGMRVFARVVDEGSFAAASRALDISPAVVTRLVAELEEHLGARLLNRTTRRLFLTDIGKSYLERVRQILAAVDDAESIASASTTEARGQLRVLCSPAFAVHQLAKQLPVFRARHPAVSVQLTVSGPVESVDDGFDVTILTEGREPLDGSFIARRLARSELIACASPEYLERRGRPQHPRELAEHETLVPGFLRDITFHRLAADATDGVGESHTIVPQSPALRTMHTNTLYTAALAGMGITGLPSFVAEDALLEHALERVLPGWHLFATTIYAGLPTRKHIPARTRAFVDFLVQAFGGEDRDPWLPAAPCESAATFALPRWQRMPAAA
ncbi:MAG TPA: LysR family transcriptional regulator [Caldimonas sp.]|jgi:DNA-binding transcriptional LysR family regulator